MTYPHYHISLFWSADDACWIADVPDLRYCTTHGDSPGEALENGQDAMAGWLEVAREQHLLTPEPQYRSAIYAARFAA